MFFIAVRLLASDGIFLFLSNINVIGDFKLPIDTGSHNKQSIQEFIISSVQLMRCCSCDGATKL